MVLQTRPIPIDEFRKFVHLPENSDRTFELIHGEIIELLPTTTYNSGIAHLISFAIHSFCREHERVCHISGFDAAYDIQGNVIVPSDSYKRASMSDDYPDPVAPELAVKVVTLSDTAADIRAKRRIYASAGILYWELYPKLHLIDVYAPGQPPRTLGINDTLDGGDVLPGFTLAIRALFEPGF